MTDREKAIVMAYTGACMLTGDKFQIFHKYVEEIMGRPVQTIEMGFIADEIKEKSKDDFMALCADEGGDAINRQVVKEQMIKYGFHAPDMTVTEFVEDLLPIAPTRKKGKWIVEIWNNREHHICSDCQRVVDYEPCYHYCPYCGEEKESEE
jgi:hypothetical protein